MNIIGLVIIKYWTFYSDNCKFVHLCPSCTRLIIFRWGNTFFYGTTKVHIRTFFFPKWISISNRFFSDGQGKTRSLGWLNGSFEFLTRRTLARTFKTLESTFKGNFCNLCTNSHEWIIVQQFSPAIKLLRKFIQHRFQVQLSSQLRYRYYNKNKTIDRCQLQIANVPTKDLCSL